MRVVIKGGVWKNTEDEILKAAVMKYGKNQWARISSLLVRKTPKQCKARWYEWLDPSIKKTDWSKEEDEKLLHLAKLMPTQWRTIAPIVGRTPAQCLERYQRLLDEADAQEEEDALGPTGDDVRKLRPGEVDPDPEVKPARPDPVDMDEDEKEMLSEARARLANTQGKKAKRKAREKQLEEAKKLASLQKRRELKAAGIVSQKKKVERGVDYNADIPFHKKAPAGFYDVNEEKEREVGQREAFKAVELSKLEGKRRADEENELRQKEAKKAKMNDDKKKMPPPPVPVKRREEFTERSKLSLPSPQVSDKEIEEIVKIGHAGETARAIVDVDEDSASRGLLGTYQSMATPMRPSQEPSVDHVLQEAKNLKAMTMAQTPLLGGESNVNVSFSRQAQATPRNLPIKTPLRDNMGINSMDYEETPRAAPSLSFASLPKPKNDFEIVVPKVEKEKPSKVEVVKDMAEIVKEREEKARLEMQKQLARRSMAVQRQLPRPIVGSALEEELKSLDVDNATPEQLLEREMLLLIVRDAVLYPVAGQAPLNGLASHVSHMKDLTEEERLQAEELIRKDLKQEVVDHRSWFENVEETNTVAHYKKQYEQIKQQMSLEASKAVSMEKKLGVLLGGYQARSQKLKKDLLDIWKQVDAANKELDGFIRLKEMEDRGIPLRIGNLQEEVENLKKLEKSLQREYAEKMERRQQLMK